ncbi:UDP-glucuronosyl [Venustampulla echinocandica]|uniref:UDP-glucuronosyl n=1 Tax=Venustampulla echinocandica TaxID=2656787 RepID=A0A370TTY0_9HELO|nr:UDP-glucuronosyl [Venustampulla echinocandica]RDL38948.1 UDP-glucuronosyl [Venustampulla echinocandica]
MSMTACTHIAISVALEDAGEATRALALARALREWCPANHEVKIQFISCGSRFEGMVEESGFLVVPCQPRVRGQSIAEDLQWELPELVGSEAIARGLIEGQLEALQGLKPKPDAVLHGMWPFASLAARMLHIPTICFLPLPLHPACVSGGLLCDLPDPIPGLTRLPRSVRKKIAGMGGFLMPRAPIFHQQRLGAAAAACGWHNRGALSLFDAVKADITLVTDLPAFYTSLPLPKNFTVTGPLFARNMDAAYSGRSSELDPDIVAALQSNGRPAILLTMASSGTSELLFEAIRGVVPSRGDVPSNSPASTKVDDWNVVILASPAICRLEEARAIAGDDPRVLVTDRFIPAPTANALADVVVSHGGQGTVQTAMAAGTPIVGVGVMMEQQINLDHVMDAGAGIRIQRHAWRSSIIRQAVRSVLADPSYKIRAEAFSESMRGIDGSRIAAERMWEFLDKLPPGSPSRVSVAKERAIEWNTEMAEIPIKS